MSHASAQGALNVICPVQAEWCSLAATEFERESGIKVAMTLKGSGESFAQIAAERANPKLDVWFGGTGDPHLQAAEQGLLDEYRSPMLGQLQPWAQRQAEQSKYRTVGMYLGALGMGARNLDNAKKFVDWALTAKAQALGAQAKQYQIPSNLAAPVSPLSPKIADIKLINYDFAKYGTSTERKRLLERWDREVGSIAK